MTNNNQLSSTGSLLDRVGIPHTLGWGYLGVLIFMMGDGLELGWLSDYLVSHGLSVQQSAALYTVYGVTIAISSWFSGVLSEGLGIRRTMLLGLIFYVAGSIGFVGFGVPELHYGVMLFTYAIRGFGYPLFAYSFLVWITYRSPQKKLGAAVGWFWFVFTGGLSVLGAYYSVWAIKHIGHIDTLWSAVIWVLIGAFFGLILNKDKLNLRKGDMNAKLQELVKGLTIVKEEPKVLLAGLVRIINTSGQFGFPVFLPLYMKQFGISQGEWLQIWGTIFTSNIAFNLIFGFVGDKMGWRNTVVWFGGVGCAIGTVMLYYIPQIVGNNFWLILLPGIFWGAMLAGYVPLSALTPSLVKKDKGAAMSILNLGAGLSVFVGPAIVGLFIGLVGAEGVIWILAILYLISAIMAGFIRLPGNAKTAHHVVTEPASTASD